MGSINNDEDMKVSAQEIYNAVMSVKNNEAGGMDEVLRFSSRKLFPLSALCFSGFLVHGILPASHLAVILETIMKDKGGKVNDRPVALASVLSRKRLY